MDSLRIGERELSGSHHPRASSHGVNRWSSWPRRPWGLRVAFTATALSSALTFVGFQLPALDGLLALAREAPSGPESWLLATALASTSFIVLSPALVAAGALAAIGRHRASRAVFLICASLGTFVLLLDAELLRSVGRHLEELVRIALSPQGHVAGGGVSQWWSMIASRALLATGATVGATYVSAWLGALLSAHLTPLVRGALSTALGILLLMGALGPHLLLLPWANTPLVERLYASALLDPRPVSTAAAQTEPADPRLGPLLPPLTEAYRAAFSSFTDGKPGATLAPGLAASPPNVILIVAESLRHDVFGPELMPRLSRWAESGFVSQQHDSGTMYSEAAMFALLYGRGPAVYHQTLNAGVPPTFCTSLRELGYECGYFTGHPKTWLRREEFLNAQTMDHFAHDDRGTWPEWDRRALDGMVQWVSGQTRPVFAIVFLMSSHFEYQYPPEFEIDLPVSQSSWRETMIRSLGPEAEIPQRNRYRNSVRFIDAAVASAIDRLDPERNLVVFVGDHGESINDDGHYTHGYAFSEIVTRTPLAMVGPGVPRQRFTAPTAHVDILPSVLHVVTGKRQALPHTHGIDWFAGESRQSMLEAYAPPGEREVRVQLRARGHRLRLDLELERPRVRLLGFEDAGGKLIPTPELSSDEADALVGAFYEEMAVLRR